MLIYEIQGQRYPEPEAETKRKMLRKHPPDAEVVVIEVFNGCERYIKRLKLNELWDEGLNT